MGNKQSTTNLIKGFNTEADPHPFLRIKDKIDEELGKETKGWLWTDHKDNPCLVNLVVLEKDYRPWRKPNVYQHMNAYISDIICHNGKTFYSIEAPGENNEPLKGPLKLNEHLVGTFKYQDDYLTVSPNRSLFFTNKEKNKANKLIARFL